MKLSKAGAKRIGQYLYPLMDQEPDEQLRNDFAAWLEDVELTPGDVSVPIVEPEVKYGDQYGKQDGVKKKGPHAELAPVEGSTESMEDPNGNN